MSWSDILFGAGDINGGITLVVVVIAAIIALITYLNARSDKRESEAASLAVLQATIDNRAEKHETEVSTLAVLQTTIESVKDTVEELKGMVGKGNDSAHSNALAIIKVSEQYTALEERVSKVEDRCEIHHDTRRQA